MAKTTEKASEGGYCKKCETAWSLCRCPNLDTRKRMEVAAYKCCEPVYRWHYICDDGFTFSAIAPTESGAFAVLNAERPGMLAEFDGKTEVPARPLSLRFPMSIHGVEVLS